MYSSSARKRTTNSIAHNDNSGNPCSGNRTGIVVCICELAIASLRARAGTRLMATEAEESATAFPGRLVILFRLHFFRLGNREIRVKMNDIRLVDVGNRLL